MPACYLCLVNKLSMKMELDQYARLCFTHFSLLLPGLSTSHNWLRVMCGIDNFFSAWLVVLRVDMRVSLRVTLEQT